MIELHKAQLFEAVSNARQISAPITTWLRVVLDRLAPTTVFRSDSLLEVGSSFVVLLLDPNRRIVAFELEYPNAEIVGAEDSCTIIGVDELLGDNLRVGRCVPGVGLRIVFGGKTVIARVVSLEAQSEAISCVRLHETSDETVAAIEVQTKIAQQGK